MEKIETPLKDLYVFKPNVFGDNRGWFIESYSKKTFESLGININFIQDNHSFSEQKGTLRGLHCQTNPKAQTKLVRCTKGKLVDVVVDVRKGSPTYLKSFKIELTEDNNLMLLVPKGFLHGFITLTDNVEIQYKVDEYYSKENDRSIKYNDPLFEIDWGVESPVLSEKDLKAPLLDNSDIDFLYEVNKI